MDLELIDQEFLGIKFKFNQELVTQIKALENRRWNPELKRWEIHISHLPEVMKIFMIHPDAVPDEILALYQCGWITVNFKIKIGHAQTTVSGSNIPVELIDEETSFWIQGSEFNPKYHGGEWDGRRHLFNRRSMQFPTGLLPRVLARLDAEKIEYTVEDNRQKTEPSLETKLNGSTKLRSYQKKAIEKAVKEKVGVFEMATGSGKTLVAAAIIAKLGRTAVFFVHTKDLLYQARKMFEEVLGCETGQIGDGVVDIKPISVATIQTTIRALGGEYTRMDEDDEDDDTDIKDSREEIIRAVENTAVVFFDECHHIPSDTCFAVAMRTINAEYRFGLSATPYRADKQDMLIEAALGAKFESINASSLIKKGYLVPPLIQFLEVSPNNNGSGANGDYQDIYQKEIVENEQRNRIIAAKAREFADIGVSTLILVNQVKHGAILSKMITEAEFVQGKDSAARRIKVLEDLQNKYLQILIATTLADEGLDVPSLGAVILAGGGKSETKALQRVGRALRIAPGKERAVIVDFLDNAQYLCEHSEKRLEIFRTENLFEIETIPSEKLPK